MNIIIISICDIIIYLYIIINICICIIIFILYFFLEYHDIEFLNIFGDLFFLSFFNKDIIKILSNFCFCYSIYCFIYFKEISFLLNLYSILFSRYKISLFSLYLLSCLPFTFKAALLHLNSLKLFLHYFFQNQMIIALFFFNFLIDLVLLCFSFHLL